MGLLVPRDFFAVFCLQCPEHPAPGESPAPAPPVALRLLAKDQVLTLNLHNQFGTLPKVQSLA